MGRICRTVAGGVIDILVLTMLLYTVVYAAAGLAERSRALVQEKMTAADWKKLGCAYWKDFVKRTNDRFEDWQHDNPSGNRNIFLNDNLLIAANGMISSSEKRDIQRFLCWLALYAEWEQELPGYIRDAEEKHKDAIAAAMKDFTWEKAVKTLKEKKPRDD